MQTTLSSSYMRIDYREREAPIAMAQKKQNSF